MVTPGAAAVTNKLPDDCFDYYMSLGEARSYQAVADRYGVSKRAVSKRASKEGWQARLGSLQSQARVRTDDRIVEDIETVNTRHLKTLRAIQARALQALQSMPLNSGMNAVRALDLAIKAERAILRPDGERRGLTLEEILAGSWDRDEELSNKSEASS